MLDKAEFRRSLLESMPDDPTSATYEELHEAIKGYFNECDTDTDFKVREDRLDDGNRISDGHVTVKSTLDLENPGSPTLRLEIEVAHPKFESEATEERALSDTAVQPFGEVHEVEWNTVSTIDFNKRSKSVNELQMDILEREDFRDDDRLLKGFVNGWKQGSPVPRDDYVDCIREYCWLTFNNVPPEQALKELIAIRNHYGDVGSRHTYGDRTSGSTSATAIRRLIAGCYAALGNLEQARDEMCTNELTEHFQRLRYFTDYCLAFGFYEDVIDVLVSNLNAERFISGRYFTEQLIIAHIKLGRIQEAVLILRQRLKLGSRNQALVNNIWSLKLQLGLRPDGLEVLSMPSAKLRKFGKNNTQDVAKKIDYLLDSYEVGNQNRLLEIWSEGCKSWRFRSRLEVIYIPESYDAPTEIETEVRRYDFTRSPSVQAFVRKLTRLAEDLAKSSLTSISGPSGKDPIESHLLPIQAVRMPQATKCKSQVPSELDLDPIKFDINYRPPKERILRFKELSWLITSMHKKGNFDPKVSDETIRLCKEQISLSYDMAHYEYLWWRYTLAQRKRNSVYYEDDPKRLEIYLDQARQLRLRPCIAYERLAIILESRNEYAEALRYIAKAKSEGRPGNWDKRIARLLKKLQK